MKNAIFIPLTDLYRWTHVYINCKSCNNLESFGTKSKAWKSYTPKFKVDASLSNFLQLWIVIIKSLMILLQPLYSKQKAMK